jgi:pilus assembly protein Flp/PilA
VTSVHLGCVRLSHLFSANLKDLASSAVHFRSSKPWKGELMMRSLLCLRRLIENEEGVTAIEYGLIAALIAVAAVVVMGTVGTNLSLTFSKVAASL